MWETKKNTLKSSYQFLENLGKLFRSSSIKCGKLYIFITTIILLSIFLIFYIKLLNTFKQKNQVFPYD